MALEEDSLQELMAVCSNGASLKEWSHADVVKAITLWSQALRFQASGDAEIKTVPRHFARANQADRCITLVHCAQRLTP